jgi:hypothetical protein
VQEGKITTVKEAAERAAAELGKPKPQNVWSDTVRGELGRSRGHLANVLEKLDILGTNTAKPGEFDELLDEIVDMAGRIRAALVERGVVA